MNPAMLWWWSCRAYQKRLVPVAKLLKLTNYVLFRAILPYEARIERDLILEHYALGIVSHPNVTIGKRVRIFHQVTIAASACVDSEYRVVIGDDVVVGAGAILIARENQSLLIGDRATVGAGAVVTRNVAACDTVIGSPARSAYAPSGDMPPTQAKENEQSENRAALNR